MNIENGQERKPEFTNLSTIWANRREKIRQRTETPSFAFGIGDLDRVTHGVAKGKVSVVAARTSEAKSSFAIQAAFNMAESGKTIIYITLEDDSEQIAERLFSNLREVDNQDLIRGLVTDEILNDKTVDEIFSKVKFLPIQDYGHNFQEIKTIIESVEPKPEIVFLDYVQMVEQKPNESEYESLSRFAQQCKKFAEINDVGLVIVSQINRSGAKEGRPQAHHLQGCGRLEQVCDLLLILYCPYSYQDSSYDYNQKTGKGMQECPQDYVEINIAKNKNGIRNWVVPVRFTGKFYKFEEWRNVGTGAYQHNNFTGVD